MTERIDWPAIAEQVVSRLLGEPNPKLTHGRRWRYGTRGSLFVDLDKACWYDHEAKTGGGIPTLIARKIGGDWKAARQWLTEQGIIERCRPGGDCDTSGGGRECGPDRILSPGRSGTASRVDPMEDADEAARIALARALWDAAVPVTGSPAMAYLARRGVWPAEEGFGPDWPSLPGALRWATRRALANVARQFVGSQVLAGYPVDAAGVLMARHLDVPGCTALLAVTMEAVAADGGRTVGERWRRTLGVLSGAACVMPANESGQEIAIVESELEALAVVLMARAGLNGFANIAEVRAVNDTSGFQPDRAADRYGRTVLLLPYGASRDERTKAEGQALECIAQLCLLERTALVQLRPSCDEEGDPAFDLARQVHEQAARFEMTELRAAVDMGLAERLAWREILKLPCGAAAVPGVQSTCAAVRAGGPGAQAGVRGGLL